MSPLAGLRVDSPLVCWPKSWLALIGPSHRAATTTYAFNSRMPSILRTLILTNTNDAKFFLQYERNFKSVLYDIVNCKKGNIRRNQFCSPRWPQRRNPPRKSLAYSPGRERLCIFLWIKSAPSLRLYWLLLIIVSDFISCIHFCKWPIPPHPLHLTWRGRVQWRQMIPSTPVTNNIIRFRISVVLTFIVLFHGLNFFFCLQTPCPFNLTSLLLIFFDVHAPMYMAHEIHRSAFICLQSISWTPLSVSSIPPAVFKVDSIVNPAISNNRSWIRWFRKPKTNWFRNSVFKYSPNLCYVLRTPRFLLFKDG